MMMMMMSIVLLTEWRISWIEEFINVIEDDVKQRQIEASNTIAVSFLIVD